MFFGHYLTKFSGQGRVILPKKIRLSISGEMVVLTRGFEGCILGFSAKDWLAESSKQLEDSITEERARNLRRYLFANSEEVALDQQGRFVIPPKLLVYAKLKSVVIIIGAGDHFEIWDQNSWDKQLKRIEKEYGRVNVK